jgi:hypothetical protein
MAPTDASTEAPGTTHAPTDTTPPMPPLMAPHCCHPTDGPTDGPPLMAPH